MTDTEVQDGKPEEAELPVAEGAMVVRERGTAVVIRDEISVTDLLEQHAKVQEAMKVAMTDGHHYGVIPGVSKPSLLKPGAEKLLVLFRLSPHYMSEKIWHDDKHLTVSVVCELRHIPTGLIVATGEGLCTTRESRYAYRQQKRTCPACGMETIIKGKAEYGGGWICHKKQGGCGAKFDDGDAVIEEQEVGRVENPELADSYNTVLKMADKRALVAAILNGTAASDVFTQDVEDQPASAPSVPAESGGATDFDWTTFDPGAVRYPDAPRDWKEINLTLKALDGSRDWPFLVKGILMGKYGVEKVKQLGEHGQEAGRRMSNMAYYLAEVVMEGKEFPPPSDDDLVGAIQWAFDGLTVEFPEPEVLEGEVVEEGENVLSPEESAALAAEDSIEFGEEAKP